MQSNYHVDIVADSISEHSKRITTFVLTYPRFIHSELMTHRLFSRNAMSSRAVPVNKMIEHVEQNTAMPLHWGKNQPGMQAKEEHNSEVTIDLNWILDGLHYKLDREQAWKEAMKFAVSVAEGFHEAGYHKQIVNRILEPFQLMRTVVTATDFDNWYWLRDHADAQPEIKMLASMMLEAHNKSQPKQLHETEWHVPFYMSGIWSGLYEKDTTGEEVDRHGHTLEEALMISASCCAQASFRKADESIEKAKSIYKKLVEMRPVHASPFEHQARPITQPQSHKHHWEWEPGVTHMDNQGRMWSGNFNAWIQYRQLIDDNACWNYEKLKQK